MIKNIYKISICSKKIRWTLPIRGSSVDTVYTKDENKYVTSGSVSNSILYKDGEQLVRTSVMGDSTNELKYKR